METTKVTWNRLRELVKKRDKCICFYCGKVNENGHCDHIIPLSKGGTDSIDNLVWSCEKCNLKKKDKIFIPKKNKTIKQKVLEFILRKAIPPYPESTDLHFMGNNDYYRYIVGKMKKSKLSWLRELIWPTPLKAQDYFDDLQWVEDMDKAYFDYVKYLNSKE